MSRPDLLTAIDLFAGCGGLTKGLRSAGFDVRVAVEIDESCAKVYAKNHRSTKVVVKDIRDVSIRSICAAARLKKGQLDLLAGCPPCQGFSKLRTKNGHFQNRDPRNSLIFEMLRLVRGLRPKTVMLENVPTLINYRGFRKFVNHLKEHGYRVTVSVVNAANFNVPQRRRRLILVAARSFDPVLAAPSKKIRTVRTAIGRLRSANSSGDKLHRSSTERRSEDIMKIIRSIPRNGGSRDSLPGNLVLNCHKEFRGFKDVYGRMSWDDVAPTITGGCFNPSKGRFLHPVEDRPITIREAALLQGFPKSYFFDADMGLQKTALMIGNALPPPLVAAHARILARGLRNARQKPR